MFYTLTVSYKGKFLFTTAKSGITDQQHAKSVFALFQEKFPTEAGYKITVMKWEHSGTELIWN